MIEGGEKRPVRRTADERKEDIRFLTDLMKNEELTKEIGGRSHKYFSTICSRITIDETEFLARVSA